MGMGLCPTRASRAREPRYQHDRLQRISNAALYHHRSVPQHVSSFQRNLWTLVRLAITKYSCLFGSLCKKLFQSKINERNPFRPAVILFGHPYQFIRFHFSNRLQNSPYFCVFKYARAVKQKVLNEAENREREWGERFLSLVSHALRACEARALRALKTLTPRFAEFFTDFEKKTDCFAVYFSKKNFVGLSQQCLLKFFVQFVLKFRTAGDG